MDSTLSSLFATAESGDRVAADQLFAALYDELHRMARRELSKRGAGATLGATTVLHEAYLDISERERATFPDRNRFLGYASRVMRGLIIDYSRRRQAQKRGGLFEITAIATDVPDVGADADRLSDLSEALEGLEAADPRLARIVDLKYLLRLFVRRDRQHARPVRAHRPAGLGKGPDLPAPGPEGRSQAGVTGFRGRLRSSLQWTLAWT